MTAAGPLLEAEAVRVAVGKWAIDCGQRVAVRRKALGFDRRQLAELAGTTEATIHRIESGKLHPRDPMKLLVASALCVEVEEIWQWPRRSRIHDTAAAVA